MYSKSIIGDQVEAEVQLKADLIHKHGEQIRRTQGPVQFGHLTVLSVEYCIIYRKLPFKLVWLGWSG